MNPNNYIDLTNTSSEDDSGDNNNNNNNNAQNQGRRVRRRINVINVDSEDHGDCNRSEYGQSSARR